jgi:hypothetical protein
VSYARGESTRNLSRMPRQAQAVPEAAVAGERAARCTGGIFQATWQGGKVGHRGAELEHIAWQRLTGGLPCTLMPLSHSHDYRRPDEFALYRGSNTTRPCTVRSMTDAIASVAFSSGSTRCNRTLADAASWGNLSAQAPANTPTIE